MPWSPVQRVRLGIEKETLEKYFIDRVTWIDPTEETKVDVNLASNSDKEYKLRIYIPQDFPNSCPKLFIVSPESLVTRDGQLIPTRSAVFHTLERMHGFQSICHFYPPDWTADNTLYQVFMKGRLWIEAYEAHLKTGRNLDDFLGHQKYTSDPSNPWIPDLNDEDLGEVRPQFRARSHNRNLRERAARSVRTSVRPPRSADINSSSTATSTTSCRRREAPERAPLFSAVPRHRSQNSEVNIMPVTRARRFHSFETQVTARDIPPVLQDQRQGSSYEDVQFHVDRAMIQNGRRSLRSTGNGRSANNNQSASSSCFPMAYEDAETHELNDNYLSDDDY